jgi:hypothetical protein
MGFLNHLGHDRARTRVFDRSMRRLYVALTVCACVCGTWTALAML